ncbi:beta-ig-h3 fasciclin [Pyrenophora tritici-repentis]|uniref:Fasciclin domain containing protein n=2 Tax=Pyrenophora tritici-repentis TaxID=45151 RepID=A0A922NHE5_9PLEO|nr:beta-Ig-H3/Fasciclin [Pyrenophora tritici-repentis Pt-1C-BFP]EDU46006.1 beta-Ig-H3/Fasciclin [Pyrenophora tritici-repentis Pt-1C-BFP]KAI1515152.1 Fasciclin domain containing protein [Pyrenophora tritici-repentis]KAI1666373.1 beta-ig-h3 fasciclin [Pyrenophora tritici-repentis]KAI1679398.1 beta-ig-h3 fasciclin [Pyrenophora tritici-repentis]
MVKPLSALALAGLAVAQNNAAPDLVTALTGAASELSTLAGLVPASILTTLSSLQNITLLAPSNAAFAKVNNATLGALTANPGLLSALLTYHVLNGTFASTAITEDSVFVPTLLTNTSYANVTGGQRVEVEEEDDKVVFYSGLGMNSTVTTADVRFSGGVIHIIDTVLSIPPAASDALTAGGLTSLRGALVRANLVDTVNTTPDVTIFAPNNDAFKNIGSALPNLTTEQLTSILTYHVVAGTVGYSAGLTNGTKLKTVNGAELTITIDDDDVFVNDARVIMTDVLIGNGVVHVIDEVLNPNNATIASPDADEGDPAFEGATPVSDAPFTSGQPTPTVGLAPGSGSGAGGAGGAAANPTSSGPPQATTNAAVKGAVGVGALFGAAAVYLL